MKTSWMAVAIGLVVLGCVPEEDVAGEVNSEGGAPNRPITEEGPPGTVEGSGGNAGSDPFAAYCSFEARCIPRCACQSGTCDCSSAERAAECAEQVESWGVRQQSAKCESRIGDWITCLDHLPSCDQAEAFFRAHPDDVVDTTPCAAEFFALSEVCNDFEPLTDYSFEADEPTAEVDPLFSAYCAMEARCIEECVCGEKSCPCDSLRHQQACPTEVANWSPWTQHPSCAQTTRSWMSCMIAQPCAAAAANLSAQPDDVNAATPCGQEYLDLTCDDWGPSDEYGF